MTERYIDPSGVVHINPASERERAYYPLVNRAYRLARRCGWRLHMCRRRQPYGEWVLRTPEGHDLTPRLSLEAAIALCAAWSQDVSQHPLA